MIDLNCDMGEGMDSDASIFPFITSANIACGGHAGDVDTMRRTVELAMRHGVAIGAHPSYVDRAGFGRIDLLGKSISLAELPGQLHEQLLALQNVCREFGVRLRHVKPHGALYNRAAKDTEVCGVINAVIKSIDCSLLLYGLSGSEMQASAELAGLHFVSEVFADRTYRPDGSLTPRTEAHALIEDSNIVLQQALKMVREGVVDCWSADGRPAGTVRLRAET
ncbi:MAG: LamB/YcsF family protein, partial [Bacteroidetes bacterium]|nr:LamB/YcsF family protein [Bacteroidota bacterium]